MTMFALQRRAIDCGITISSLHPGTVATEISRNYEDIPFASLAVKAFMALSNDEAMKLILILVISLHRTGTEP